MAQHNNQLLDDKRLVRKATEPLVAGQPKEGETEASGKTSIRGRNVTVVPRHETSNDKDKRKEAGAAWSMARWPASPWFTGKGS